jgi:hypothetical protein
VIRFNQSKEIGELSLDGYAAGRVYTAFQGSS